MSIKSVLGHNPNMIIKKYFKQGMFAANKNILRWMSGAIVYDFGAGRMAAFPILNDKLYNGN